MRLRNLTPARIATSTYTIDSVPNLAHHMLYHLLCFLLLVTYCSSTAVANKVNYLPIGALGDSTEANGERMTIELPPGFHPQPPPNRPMLLPFVTPASDSPSGGWKPIVGTTIAPPRNIAIPRPMPLMPPPLAVLQQRIDTASREVSVDLQEGQSLEAIVYGTWKPERPLGPDEIRMLTTRPVSSSTQVYSSERSTASSEYLDLEHPIAGVQTAAANLNQNSGRKHLTSTRSYHSTASPVKYMRVNMSEPHLLEMAKQINDTLGEISTHTHTLGKQNWPQPSTEISIETENETEMEAESETEMETLPIDITKVWPTDFIALLEQDNQRNLTQYTNNYSFVVDSSDPPLALNGLNISNTLLPQLPPLNITKMGAPYEKQNTGEGPAICVPLTVEELSQGQVSELERVYCFPLPPSPKETMQMNDMLAKELNYTDFESVNSAQRLSLNNKRILSLSLTILKLLKLKYS